jgi:hypothetical protein
VICRIRIINLQEAKKPVNDSLYGLPNYIFISLTLIIFIIGMIKQMKKPAEGTETTAE